MCSNKSYEAWRWKALYPFSFLPWLSEYVSLSPISIDIGNVDPSTAISLYPLYDLNWIVFSLKTSKTYLKDLLSIFVIDNKPHVCEDLSILWTEKNQKKSGGIYY